MNVLLTTLNSKYIHTNLAIRYLYQLNKNYQNLNYAEFTIKDDINKVVQYCSKYDLIAFSCYLWNIVPTLEIAKKIKQVNTNILIMLGGPEVSYQWEEIIANECIDFIVLGEGEQVFGDFLTNYPNCDNIENLVFKQNGKIIVHQNPKHFDLRLLDNINPYEYDKIHDLRNKVCYIEASRGCPYVCSFCLASMDKPVRYFAKETVFQNIEFLLSFAKTVKFLDRTFNSNVDFAIEIFDFIIRNNKNKTIFQFEIKADIYQPRLIEYIKTNVPKGIFRFEIGIQTLNNRANIAIGRKYNFENVKQFINEVKDKVEIHVDLIVGLPYDTWDNIKQGFEEVFSLFAPELQFGFLKMLKGSKILNEAHLYDYKFAKQPPYEVISNKFLSSQEIAKLKQLEAALEILWNKKRALLSLRYIASNYSIFDFLLKIGEQIIEFEHHSYTLERLFEKLFNFAQISFPNDKFVKQIVAIDYFMQFKVRPRVLFIVETNLKRKAHIMQQLKLNPNIFRYVIFDIDFDLFHLMNKNEIIEAQKIVIIEYSGREQPRLMQI